MHRLTLLTLALTLTAVPMTSCKKKDGETADPDGATAEKQDPIEELKAIPADIQGEVDLVLQPITDAEQLMSDIESAPERLKISLPELKGMLKAAFDADVKADAEGVDASVDVDLEQLDVTAEARQELQAMLELVRSIKTGLAATPKNATTATANIVAHGARATAVATKVTATLQAKMTVAMGGKKDELAQQISEVAQVKADIESLVQESKAKVTEIPAEATQMGVKLAASFAGSASAGSSDDDAAK